MQDTLAVYEKTVRNKNVLDFTKGFTTKKELISKLASMNYYYNEKYYKIIIMESEEYFTGEIIG